MILNFIFFILPFLLYLGIALQGLAFYIICILIPAIYFIIHKKEIPKFISLISLCFIALHLIFPLTSFLNYFFQNHEISQFNYHIEMKWPGILQSNFPSSLFIGSVLIIILSMISKKNAILKDQKNDTFNIKIMPLKYFLAGLLPASILICLTLIYQHNYGIDYRSLKGGLLAETELLDNGKYRVYGFYGHPLTVASVGLAYVSFTWSLLCYYLVNKNNIQFNFIPFTNRKYISEISLSIITFCNFIIVILSSGRTASITCFALLVFIPIILCIRKKPILTITTVFFIFISSYFIGNRFGIIDRIIFTTKSVTQSHSLDAGNYRQYFWEVHTKMFLDKPIIGQGNYWLKAGLRENYYDKLGYEDIPEKFNAHNIFLEILASGGLLASVWILIFSYLICKLINKQLNAQKNGYVFLIFCLYFMYISNIIHSFTQNVFFDSSVVYIYIALIYVIIWQISSNKKINNL